MNERLKYVRKELKLNQVSFGKKLGVTGPAIAKIETGARNLTEQMIISICREFNVNENWLRTGEGEMFIEKLDTSYLYGKALAKNNEFQMNLLDVILQLDDDELALLEGIVEKLQKK